MNILKKSKIAHKSLCLLLLALFAGNVDAAQVRSVLDTYNSIEGVSKVKTMKALLELLNNDACCKKIVNTAAEQKFKKSDPQLKTFISSLVYTINNDAVNREKAAEALRKIIFSQPNKIARENLFLHSAAHYSTSLIKTEADYVDYWNRLSDKDKKNKKVHTVFGDERSQDIFSDSLKSILSNNAEINFTGTQIIINIPLENIRKNVTSIQEFYKITDCKTEAKRGDIYTVEPKKTSNYEIICYINIDPQTGLIKAPKPDNKIDGQSGSCYPQKKNTN